MNLTSFCFSLLCFWSSVVSHYAGCIYWKVQSIGLSACLSLSVLYGMYSKSLTRGTNAASISFRPYHQKLAQRLQN